MKKVGIAVVMFLLSASPTYAAWNFGDFLSPFANRPPGYTRPTPRAYPTKVQPTGARVNQGYTAQRTQEVVTRLLSSYQNRLDNYSDFLTKVKTRRDKLASDGKDVTQLDAFIKTAEDNMTNAQNVLNSAKVNLGLLDYTKDMRELRRSIQTELQKIRLAFTQMHKSMSETVREIKQLSISERVSPTRKPFPTRGFYPTRGPR